MEARRGAEAAVDAARQRRDHEAPGAADVLVAVAEARLPRADGDLLVIEGGVCGFRLLDVVAELREPLEVVFFLNAGCREQLQDVPVRPMFK